MAPLHFSARTQTPQPTGQTMRVGIGREVPQVPVSPSSELHARRAGSPAGLELPRSGRSGPGGSVPPRCFCPRHPRKNQRPARHGGGTSAGEPSPRSARAPGPPPICAPPGQGRVPPGLRGRPAPARPLAAPLPRGLRDPGSRSSRWAPAARRRRASPARPARGRLSARRDGHPEHEQSFLPPSPAPLPGSPEATTARQRASPALTEVRRDALPPPAACSPRPAARAIVVFLEKLGRGKERGEGRGWEGTEIEGERSMQRQEVETATTSAGD